MRSLCAIILCGALSGCASQLEVFNDTQTKIVGVPFHGPELYVREGFFNKASKGGDCEKTPFVETEILPLGPVYYANISSAQFAKSGFAMKFSDKGALSEISMNTEPSSAEALKSAAELVKAVGPLVAGGAAVAPLKGVLPACDAGADHVKYTRFSEWQTAHP